MFRERVAEASEHWRENALCAQTGIDDETWFPKRGGSAAAAKRVCAACPVRMECLEDALATGEHYGVRGGLSDRERRRLMNNRRKGRAA